MNEMMAKLNTVYERLQTLDILPTKANMENLLQSLYDIRDVYNKLKEEEENAGTEARSADHSDGRDNP